MAAPQAGVARPMAQPSDDPSRPVGLTDLLDQTGIDRSSLIRVTGGHGLAALLWLCRRGYERVGYLKPGCTQERPDALIVTQACEAAALDRLLKAGPLGNPGILAPARISIRYRSSPQA